MGADMSPLTKSVFNTLQQKIPKHHGSRGRVVSFDYITKLATVRAPDPATNNLVTYHLVQVQDQGRGVQFNSLKVGTEVWLSFFGGTNPVITTVFTDRNQLSDLKVHYGPQINRYLSYL